MVAHAREHDLEHKPVDWLKALWRCAIAVSHVTSNLLLFGLCYYLWGTSHTAKPTKNCAMAVPGGTFNTIDRVFGHGAFLRHSLAKIRLFIFWHDFHNKECQKSIYQIGGYGLKNVVFFLCRAVRTFARTSGSSKPSKSSTIFSDAILEQRSGSFAWKLTLLCLSRLALECCNGWITACLSRWRLSCPKTVSNPWNRPNYARIFL